jgi:prepilin-type N-terminal cleavage/methylation domain-containing protein
MNRDLGFGIWEFGLPPCYSAMRCICRNRLLNPKSKIPNPRSRSAFTLLEVLIAIAIVAALVGSMFGFLFDLLSARVRVLEHVRQREAAATVIRQLDSDLAACIVGDAANGAGISGDESRIRVLTRGVSANLAPRGVDEPDLLGDLQFAEFRFDPGFNRIEGRRGSLGRSRGPAQTASFAPIEGDIYKLRFRYFDGTTWRKSYDSLAQAKLPIAVEAAVWLHPLPEQAVLSDSVDDSRSAGTGTVGGGTTMQGSAAAFDERA